MKLLEQDGTKIAGWGNGPGNGDFVLKSASDDYIRSQPFSGNLNPQNLNVLTLLVF